MAAEVLTPGAGQSAGAGVDVVRWYTRARRFPLLVGRTPDGTQLPGGPYTIPQILAGAGAFALGTFTRGIWGAWGLIGDTVVLALVSWGVVFAVGKVPLSGRNPVAAAYGLYTALAAPSSGRIAGRPVRIRPPRVARGEVRIHIPQASIGPEPPGQPGQPGQPVAGVPGGKRRGTSPASALAAAAAASLATAPPAAAPAAPLTGVQALLAAAGTHSKE